MIARATSLRRVALPWTQRRMQVRPTAEAWLGSLTAENRLGMMPLVSLIGAFGLLLISLADTAGRLQLPGGQVLFWLGYLTLVCPFAVRLLGRSASRHERIALVALLGLGLYVIKLLHSPGAFVMFDEFHHWATLDDILQTGQLFTHNNILPASPFYPGLEIATDPLVRAGGSIWDAGVLVIGGARLLMVLAMFLFFERVSGSTRLAGVATLAYMANPSFLFFDAQFAYESLALPLAIFVIYCLARRERGSGDRALPLTVTILLGLGAVIITHHVTSFLLAVFLLGWAAVSIVLRWLPTGRAARAADAGAVRSDSPGLLGPALITLFGTVAWMLYWASVTVGYLAPAFGSAVAQILELVAGEESGRELFRAATGGAAPVWEQLLGYGSVALLLAAMATGGVMLWRRGRHNAALATLGITALAYPATLAARFTTLGAELSARSAAFLFVGLGFVVALAAIAIADSPRLRRNGLLVVTGGLAAVFMGGVVLGFPYWARLPGPFLVSADSRSVGPLGIQAATWMLDHVGPENRLMTDRVNRALTATYGRQHPISAVGDQVDVKAAYFAAALDAETRRALVRARVRYVLADRRLPTSLPYTGVYVERGEIRNGSWTEPLPAIAIEKWDTMASVDRIYDNGAIRLYDLRVLLNVRN